MVLEVASRVSLLQEINSGIVEEVTKREGREASDDYFNNEHHH